MATTSGGVSTRQFLRELRGEIGDDDVFNGAAALAFYLTLAIFPAMIFVMAVVPYLPIADVDVAIMDLLHQAMPAQAADMFADVVAEVTTQRRGGLLSFGLLAVVWAMSSGMAAVMQQLNVTYDVKESRGIVKVRLVAIALSVLFAVLVIAAFSAIVLGGALEAWMVQRFGFGELAITLFAMLRWAIIVAALLLMFALVYYLAPDVEQKFRYITPGAVLGVVLLSLASMAFGWYAQNFGNYDATYGSIGAVIVLMLWLYIAGIAILLGSEVNALAEHHAAEGKLKGEHAPGEATHDARARQRVRHAAP